MTERHAVLHCGSFGVEAFEEEINRSMSSLQKRGDVRIIQIHYQVEPENMENDAYYTALIHYTFQENE
jgi:hypothetical protein